MVSFSIILCNYNHARYLEESLGSICRQAEPGDQILVIDDGSTDHSLEIIERFARRFATVTVLRNATNCGVVSAGGAALSHATGRYVGWFAADDLVAPQLLARARAALDRNPGIGVVAGEADFRAPEGTDAPPPYRFELPAAETVLSPAALVAELRRRYLWLPAQGALVHRESLVAAAGWREDIDWLSDWFAVYVVALRRGVVCLGTPLVTIRVTPDSYGLLAQRQPERRDRVLRRLLNLLRTPEYSDLRPLMRAGRYLLLVPFSWPLLRILARRPLDWDLLAVLMVARLENSLRVRLRRFERRR